MAKDIKRHIQHLKNGTGAKPTSGASTELLFGEIAVGYKAGEEALYILDSNSGITEFNPTTTVLALAENYTDTKIGALDAAITGSAGAGKTLTAFSQTDGKVTATFGNISITKSQVSDFPTIGNGTLTINGNATAVATFTANQTGNTSFTISGGSNVTVTPDATGKKVTIAASQPTVNNGTFTISGNGTSVASTSANASGNTGLNIKSGSNVTITTGTNEITIAATDTKYTAATSVTSIATAKTVGTSANYARQDHVHDISLATGDGVGQVKIAGKNVSVSGFLASETALTSTSDSVLPTSKAVADYVSQQMASALTYKGAISSNDTLKPPYKKGDVWVVQTAGTYAGKACEVGDYLIANKTVTAGTSVTNGDWDAINGENQVENKSASLAAAGSSAILATVDGTNITVTTPSTWTGVAKTGTVTKVSTGAGLVGGDITTTGTLKAALSSETKSTLAATAMGSTDNRQYAVGLDKNGVLSVNIPWTNTTYNVVTTSENGLAPIMTTTASTIATQASEFVLTTTSGGTPSWRKLPSNAFNNTNYYTTGLTVATATTSNTISVSGNNAVVKGNAVLSAATTSAAGLMASTDKTALNNLNPLSGKVSTLSAITASSTAINSLTGSVGTMAFKTATDYEKNLNVSGDTGSTAITYNAKTAKNLTIAGSANSGGTSSNAISVVGESNKLVIHLNDIVCGDYA